MRTRRPLPLLGGLFLALAALACTCGPLSAVGRVAATLQAVGSTAEAIGPTLEIQLTEFGPRVQAELTRLAEDVTRRGPEVYATATAAAATADALGSVPGAAQTQAARQAAIAETARALYDQQHPVPANTPEPGNNGINEPLDEVLIVGQTRTASIAEAGGDHNWYFDAQAGQSVTVEVISAAGVPPGLTIFAPEGHLLYETAGSAEPFARIDATLPTAGRYTISVSLPAPGEYTITLGE